MGAYSILAEALGDELEDYAVRNFKGFTEAQRDGINGVGQHHVALDDDLPIRDAPLQAQSARVIALLHFRKERTSDPGRENVDEAWDGTRLALCRLRI